MKTCSNCHVEIPATAKVCGHCGTWQDAGTSKAPAPAPAAAPASDTAPAPAPTPAPDTIHAPRVHTSGRAHLFHAAFPVLLGVSAFLPWFGPGWVYPFETPLAVLFGGGNPNDETWMGAALVLVAALLAVALVWAVRTHHRRPASIAVLMALIASAFPGLFLYQLLSDPYLMNALDRVDLGLWIAAAAALVALILSVRLLRVARR